MSPRCGKPMRRFEAVWGPQPEEPECGRREGHNPPCRSVQAVRQYLAADVARIAAARQAGRYERWWVAKGSAA